MLVRCQNDSWELVYPKDTTKWQLDKSLGDKNKQLEEYAKKKDLIRIEF